MNEAVACPDDGSPGDLRMGIADPFRDPRCRIIDELEVAEGGVVANRASVERGLVQPGRLVPDPFAEPDHGPRRRSATPTVPVPAQTRIASGSTWGRSSWRNASSVTRSTGQTQQVFDIELRAEVAF